MMFKLIFSILFDDDTNVFLEGVEYHKILTDECLKANKLIINLKNPHYMLFHFQGVYIFIL